MNAKNNQTPLNLLTATVAAAMLMLNRKVQPLSEEEIKSLIPARLDAEKVISGMFQVAGKKHFIRFKHLVRILEGANEKRGRNLHEGAMLKLLRYYVEAYIHTTQPDAVSFKLEDSAIKVYDHEETLLGWNRIQEKQLVSYFRLRPQVTKREITRNLNQRKRLQANG